MKITDREKERIISLYGSQMSVSDITKEINKDKDKKLQVSRQAVSKILLEFRNSNRNQTATKSNQIEYKEVARNIYSKALQTLQAKLDKSSVKDLVRVIEFYETLYHFSEEQSESSVEAISITIENGGEDDTED